MTGISVGGVSVGEWTDDLTQSLQELGAAVQNGRIQAGNDVMNAIKAKMAIAQAAAKQTPALAPIVKLGTAAQRMSTTVLNLATASRYKKAEEREEQPTHVIPVCFDAVGPNQASGIATIGAPHDQPWRLVGIMVNDAQATGIRVVSLKFGNTEHVIQSNVTFTAGGPTNPGIDASVFSGKLYLGNRAQFRYRPWGLGPSGWIRSDAKVVIQVFNPGASAASLNISLLVQSSPCGENSMYDDTFVHPKSRKLTMAFNEKMGKGLLNLFRRAA